jgi:hypothetical protein
MALMEEATRRAAVLPETSDANRWKIEAADAREDM